MSFFSINIYTVQAHNTVQQKKNSSVKSRSETVGNPETHTPTLDSLLGGTTV